jgi:hypothetical protein
LIGWRVRHGNGGAVGYFDHAALPERIDGNHLFEMGGDASGDPAQEVRAEPQTSIAIGIGIRMKRDFSGEPEEAGHFAQGFAATAARGENLGKKGPENDGSREDAIAPLRARSRGGQKIETYDL